MYLISAEEKTPASGCVFLYGGDPELEPDSVGLAACGDYSAKKTWYFTQAIIENFGLGSLKDYSGGTTFIRTGSDVCIFLFSYCITNWI